MSFLDVQERFAASLVALREERNMTIDEFCEFCGIGKSSYDYYVRQGGMPTLYTAMVIADRLGLTLDQLLSAGERRGKRG